MATLADIKSFIAGFEGDEQQTGVSELLTAIEKIEQQLTSVQALAGNLHTLKGLRVWATEENCEIKASILRIVGEILA